LPKNKFLLIWDTDKGVRPEHDTVVLWQSYNSNIEKNEIAISQLVENNAEKLKSEYLVLVYDLGEAQVDDKRVVDHLEIRPGFSYWWMTPLAMMCNYSKSSQIDNSIKLMAFNKWLQGKSYDRISLVSSNAELAEAFHLLSKKKNILFNWLKIPVMNPLQKRWWQRVYKHLPYMLQVVIWLGRYLVNQWPFRNNGGGEWSNSKARVTFVSYLFNKTPDSVENGVFKSDYWGTLPKLLNKNQIASNWLHIPVGDNTVTSKLVTKRTINKFNQSSKGKQIHLTLDSFVSIRLLLQVFRDCCTVYMKKEKIGSVLKRESGYLWPLLKADFRNCFSDKIAIINLLHFSLMEKAMAILPNQKIGCYLQENQEWEFGFINAWQTSGHGKKLIGVPHSTVRYWDFRYFYDSRSYERNNRCELPLPNIVAVNGNVAKNMFLDGGYPEDHLVEVEALRYLHMLNGKNKKTFDDSKTIVLILGDYLNQNTVQQMALLQETAPLIDNQIQYIVKPHPNCPIYESDYPGLQMEISNEPIFSLIDVCTLAFTSSTTSASVDAYCAGKPVIIFLDHVSLNQSPLRGVEGISYVSSPEELAAILNRIDQMKTIQISRKDFFYLDSELPRWTELLVDNYTNEQKESLDDVH